MPPGGYRARQLSLQDDPEDFFLFFSQLAAVRILFYQLALLLLLI